MDGGATAEISDQERQLARAELVRQCLRRGLHSLDGRHSLDPVEQRADVQAGARRSQHGRTLGRAFAATPASGVAPGSSPPLTETFHRTRDDPTTPHDPLHELSTSPPRADDPQPGRHS